MAEVFIIIGFMLAAYSIVGNDSIQTLGTFLYSNSQRPWWMLCLFSSTVMVGVILYGWANYNHDPSFARLNKVYDKSVSLEEVEGALALALASVEDEPAQPTIQMELKAVASQIHETKRIFVKEPQNLDGAIAGLQKAIEQLRAELANPSVPNPQRVAVAAVLEQADVIVARLQERRDVRNFIDWTYLIPPFVLLLLTRYGFPVSTSFLVLVTFQPAVLTSMLHKSVMGYALAFVSAILIYLIVMRLIEARWRREGEKDIHPAWVVMQWLSTGFLWAMWLVQDMANIFVYLPRQPSLGWLGFAIAWMLLVQLFIYYTHGGKIQKVVTSKTNTHDIRSATIVDLVYGALLYYFKVQSNVPMSTTWVFLGLLAGREIAFAFSSHHQRSFKQALKIARKDMVKAGFGLGVSVVIAYLINMV